MWVVTALLGNSRPDRRLLDAIDRPAGRVAEVKDILASGANPNALDFRDVAYCGHEGQTALHYAAKWQGDEREELVRLLLASGAVPGTASRYGHTPLHYLALHGASSEIALLLDAGADINAFNKVGHAPLHYAAANARYNSTKILLDRGADVNAHAASKLAGDCRVTPIIMAVARDTNIDERLQVIDLLIRNGAFLTTTQYLRTTPLNDARQSLESCSRVPSTDGTPRAVESWKRMIALLESQSCNPTDT